MSSRPSLQPMLWFCVVLLLVFALFASGNRPSGPAPSPFAPFAPRHSFLGNVAAWAVDLFTGGRPFRSANAADYPIRAGQLENLDTPVLQSADGVPLVAHERGW